MAQRTEDDLKTEWKTQLGNDKGAYYHHFWHQLNHLHMVWRELKTMGTHQRKEQRLLKATIDHFWLVASNSMWKEVIVGLCGYNDPVPKDRSKVPDSVSFPYWMEDHTSNLSANEKTKLEEAIKRYKSRLSPLRHVRNKYLGHWNADEWFNKKAPVIKPEYVERTLSDIEAVLRVMERQNGLGGWHYGGGPDPLGGAADLLFCLRSAKEKWDEDDRKRDEERARYRAEREKGRKAPSK